MKINEKRKLPEPYNTSLSTNISKDKSKTGQVSFNVAHLNIGNLLSTGAIRGPQTQSSAASL